MIGRPDTPTQSETQGIYTEVYFLTAAKSWHCLMGDVLNLVYPVQKLDSVVIPLRQ